MGGLKLATRTKRPPRTDSESTLNFIPTMQPKLVDEPPSGDGWLHEIKYDGYRTQLIIEGGQVRALTRNGHDWTEKYGPIVRSARALDCSSAIIDGEVCVQNEAGATDFHSLRRAITSEPQRLVFFAFDLLHLNGEDLRSRPLEERRAHLRFLMSGAVGPLHMSDEYDGDGASFFALVEGLELEGIVSKKKGSRYISGETRAWLKTKCWHTDTFDVIGVERDKTGISYALLADENAYRGAAFIALPAALRDIFWHYVECRGIPSSSVVLPKRKDATWIRPGLRARVRHLKGSDKLRHATVNGIEIDDS
jgi:bifunctional non-homologous end joining protein LigD